MNENLIQTIKKKLPQFSNTNKKIARVLINEKPHMRKMKDLCDVANVSLSQCNRFVKLIGYKTWIHFIYDYNQEQVFTDYKSDLTLETLAEKFANAIKNKEIFLVSSRRSKSIAKFMNERLNDANIVNYYFSEYKTDAQEFYQKSKNNAVIIIDISGQSHLIKKHYELINQIPQKDMPQKVIISASKSKKVINEKLHISFSEIDDANYSTEYWIEYNDILNRALKFILIFLNKIYEINKNIKPQNI